MSDTAETYTLRQAGTEDCLLIRRLAEEVFPQTYRDILSGEQISFMMEWMYSPESILRQMEDGHVYLLAYAGANPAGYASVEREGEDLFHLQKIYVLPRFQGKRCGSFLFRGILGYVEKVHPAPCRVELNVNRSNKAVHFYERMGMKKVRSGDFPIGNGFYMNDYIMAIDCRGRN